MFIKVHNMHDEVVYINVNQIVSFVQEIDYYVSYGSKVKTTYVVTSSEHYYIKETPEQICKALDEFTNFINVADY